MMARSVEGRNMTAYRKFVLAQKIEKLRVLLLLLLLLLFIWKVAKVAEVAVGRTTI